MNSEQTELKEIFEQLHQEHQIEDIVKFNEIDIAEKLQNNSFLIIKYKELYYEELAKLEILERKMDALKGILYKHYRFNDVHEWQKKEIEDFCIPSDAKMIKMKKIISKQQIRVRFFDTCWRALDKMGWNMKNFTDREKMAL
jgi:hypothetical protein